MNLNELKESVDSLCSQVSASGDLGLERYSVVVSLHESSIGYSAAEDVSSIHFGIDWDSYRVMIQPNRPLRHLTDEKKKEKG